MSKWQIFFLFINLKWYQFRLLYLLRQIRKTDLWKIEHFADWVEESERHITKQFIPSFKIRFTKFKGKENFGSLNFWQFVQADTFSQKYIQTKDKAHLISFLNVLYTSKSKNSKKLLANLNPLYANIILLWFQGNKIELVKRYKQVFPQDTEPNEYNYTNFGWVGIIKSLSVGLTDMKKVGEEPVHTALNYLNMEITHSKEREAEAKRQAKK
ncbi:hypothetical protein V9L05_01260 [Bernardetia sp. Wsw4-3y2]|uniref:hypothetical protein n=1 Tax=Bernardetia sp. Wsw4-3y2 TaxID=3127471 RepID=UPI0030D29995